KNIKNGGLLIKCDGSEDASKLKELASLHLADDYEVKEVRKFNPRLKIVGMSECIDKDQLSVILKSQNSVFQNGSSTSLSLRNYLADKQPVISSQTFVKALWVCSFRIVVMAPMNPLQRGASHNISFNRSFFQDFMTNKVTGIQRLGAGVISTLWVWIPEYGYVNRHPLSNAGNIAHKQSCAGVERFQKIPDPCRFYTQ
ncbi:unnamed protein product, partial [Acanthoscelides obtectus]